MNAFSSWANVHPVFMFAIVWPIVTALFVAIFKPRTPEEYAKSAARNPVWFFARWTAFCQLMGAWGLDPYKTVEALQKVVSGRADSPPRPPWMNPGGPLLAITSLAALTLGLSSCTPGERQAARTALDVAEVACVLAHQELEDTEVASVCSIADPLFEPMRKILAEARKASAAAAQRAGTCQPSRDGGVR